MIEHSWVEKIFDVVRSGGVSVVSNAQPIICMMEGLEYMIDQLILGNINEIYLSIADNEGLSGLELTTNKTERCRKVFDYDTLGERYSNRRFLYLYLGDLLYELLSESEADKEKVAE